MNTNRKAHHDVLQFTANILEEENNSRADNGATPSKKTSKQGQKDHILMQKPSHRHILLQMVKRIG